MRKAVSNCSELYASTKYSRLKNPENEMLSPWFSLNFEGELYTPEWVFTKDDFKRFN